MTDEKKNIAPKVIAVIAWLLCSALMLADVLVIREATNDVLTQVQVIKAENAPEGQYHMVKIEFGSVIEQVDRSILVAGAVAVSMLSIFVEHYFRMGVKKENLVRRMLTVFGILIAILVVGVLVQTFV
ncbi:MAG: hypothetical protein V2J07_09270 [Anaerolineae bacterium]|jgi:hypothetical protein|nr:hypothetical protein [Anaerolineae bacterium]